MKFVISFTRNNNRTYYIAMYENQPVMTWDFGCAESFNDIESAEQFLIDKQLLSGYNNPKGHIFIGGKITKYYIIKK